VPVRSSITLTADTGNDATARPELPSHCGSAELTKETLGVVTDVDLMTSVARELGDLVRRGGFAAIFFILPWVCLLFPLGHRFGFSPGLAVQQGTRGREGPCPVAERTLEIEHSFP
jgi:hypothetical protein